ncbi:MAG: leucine-rich repeat protein [Bacteroidales bacterium]|nr:leucine-rich repeat protein [Bacteroidales bacterium]
MTAKVVMIVLALMMVVGARAYDFEEDGLYYKILDEGSVEVTHKFKLLDPLSTEKIDKPVVANIPSQVRHRGTDYAVVAIGSHAFKNCHKLTSVSIPSAVKKIGSFAFEGCSSLKEVKVSESVGEIGGFAFKNCTSLERVELPHGLSEIADCTFMGTGLTSVVIPEGVKKIGGGAFSGCEALEAVTIANSVETIGDCAFMRCEKLVSVSIPDKVESIGEWAFQYCKSIEELTLPVSLRRVGEEAFMNCKKIREVIIPNGVTDIGERAFYECEAEVIYIPKTVEKIGKHAFFNYTKSSVVCCESDEGGSGWDGNWAAGKQEVYGGVFLQGGFLFTEVEGEEAGIVKYVSDEETIVVPGKVSYGGRTLRVMGLGQESFAGTGVREVKLPKEIRMIGKGAFRDCKALRSINLPIEVKEVMEGAFVGCSQAVIKPDASTRPHRWDFDWNKDGGNVVWGKTVLPKFEYEVISKTEKTARLVCYNGDGPRETVPSSVVIGGGTYRVVSIGEEAFIGTKIAEVKLPSTLKEIGPLSFAACLYLKSIDIPNSVVKIGAGAFSNCYNLERVGMSGKTEEIGKMAFAKCRELKGITIPIKTTKIGDGVFEGCEKLVIYCDAAEVADDEYYRWNPNGRPVFYSAQGEHAKKYEVLEEDGLFGLKNKTTGDTIAAPGFHEIHCLSNCFVVAIKSFDEEGQRYTLPGRALFTATYEGQLVSKVFDELLNKGEPPYREVIMYAKNYGFTDLEWKAKIKNSLKKYEDGDVEGAYKIALDAYGMDSSNEKLNAYVDALRDIVAAKREQEEYERQAREEHARMERQAREERERQEQIARQQAAERERQAKEERWNALVNGIVQANNQMINGLQQIQQINNARRGRTVGTTQASGGYSTNGGVSTGGYSTSGGTSYETTGSRHVHSNGQGTSESNCSLCYGSKSCNFCRGRGDISGRMCDRCVGTGKCSRCCSDQIKGRVCHLCNGWGKCSFCSGGKVNGLTCKTCHGTNICTHCHGAKKVR